MDAAATGKSLLAPGVLDRRTTICPLDKARKSDSSPSPLFPLTCSCGARAAVPR